MRQIVLITGANGMLAQYLSNILKGEYQIRFLTRNKTDKNHYIWSVEEGYIDVEAFTGVNHIIHLAGAPIVGRWSKSKKRRIFSSRVDTSKLILDTLIKNSIRIKSFISASAIGFYGTYTTEKVFKEIDETGNDFLSDICQKWEKMADEFMVKEVVERVIKLRIGVVLAPNQKTLDKMVKLIRWYLGAPLGTGKQYMPWIHIYDLCSMIKYILKNEDISGVYNAVSPEHITNKHFMKALASKLKKPLWLPNVPSFILKLLFGEASCILLRGSRVCCQKIINKGFTFRYTNLKKALENLL